MATVRQKINAARKAGIAGEDIKARMRELGLRKEDVDLDYDEAKIKGQSRLTEKSIKEGLPFIGSEPLEASQIPAEAPAPVTPVERPSAPVVERARPTLSQGRKIEGEGFVKAGLRGVIPDAFGIEEAILGPKPLIYDKQQTQADIAKYKTIGPDEYSLSTKQLVRPVGLAAGVAAEAVTQAGVTLPAAVESLAGVAGQMAAGKTFKEAARAVPDPGTFEKQRAKALEQATGIPAKEFRPKGRAALAQYAPSISEDLSAAEATLRRQASKDVYTAMQDDASEVLVGLGTGLFTDIIPILPEQDPSKTTGEVFEAAYERGREMPAVLAAFGSIGVEAANRAGNGDFAGAARVLAEKPATLALTLAPFYHKLPARGKAFVDRAARFVPGVAARLARKVVSPEGRAKTKRVVSDPLSQPTVEETAITERIYEEARSTREKAAEAVREISEEKAEPKEGYLTEEGFVDKPKVDEVLAEQEQALFERDSSIESERKLSPEMDVSPEYEIVEKPKTFEDYTTAEIEKKIDDASPKAQNIERAKIDVETQIEKERLTSETSDKLRKATREADLLAEEYVAEDTGVIDAKMKLEEITETVSGEGQLNKKLIAERRLSAQKGKVRREYFDTPEGQKARKALKELQDRINQDYEKSIKAVDKKAKEAYEAIERNVVEVQEGKFVDKLNKLKENTYVEAENALLKKIKAEQKTKTTAVLDPSFERVAFPEAKEVLIDPQSNRPLVDKTGESYDITRLEVLQVEEISKRVKELSKKGNTNERVFEILDNPLEPTLESKALREIRTEHPKLYQVVKNEILENGTLEGIETTASTRQRVVEVKEPQRLVESFEPSLPDTASGIANRHQASPKIREIIAKGVADIVDKNIITLLVDPKTRSSFAKSLVKEYIPRAQYGARTSNIKIIGNRLRELVKAGDLSDISIQVGSEFIGPEKLKSKLSEFLDEQPKTEAGKLHTAIKDSVIFKVKQAAFKESLSQNIKYETAGIKVDVPGDPFAARDPARLTTTSNPLEVIQDVLDRAGTDNMAPAGVVVPKGASLDAIADGVAKQKPLVGETIRGYIKPDPVLAKVIGSDIYVAPSFNASFGNILRALDAVNKVNDGFFGFDFIRETKVGYTSRNIASARNNLKSNVLLYTLYYGLNEGAIAASGIPSALYKAIGSEVFGKNFKPSKMLNEAGSAYERFANKKPKDVFEADLFKSMRESGLVDNTNISNEVSLLNKSSLMSDVAGKIPVVGKAVSRFIKRTNAVQDTAYTFGDNYFKFLAAYQEIFTGKAAIEKLTPIAEGSVFGTNVTLWEKGNPMMTLRLDNNIYIDIVKGSDGKIYRLLPGDRGPQSLRRRLSRKPLTDRQLNRYLSKGAARLSFQKFVDYERIPGYLGFLRAQPTTGLVSLFTTWAYKMMDLPGKRGIAGHFLAGETVISKTTDPGVASMLKTQKVNRGASRAAAVALAKSQIDSEQDPNIRRMLAWNKKGMVPIIASVSQLDPWSFVYRDETATNFFAPSEAVARLLLGTGIAAADAWFDNADTLAGSVRDLTLQKGENPRITTTAGKEARKLWMKWRSGEVVSAKDALAIAGVGGTPLFDLVDMAIESEKNPNVDLAAYTVAWLKNMTMGATTRALLESAYGTQRTHQDVLRDPNFLDKTFFRDRYKKSLSSAFRSRQRDKIDAADAYSSAARSAVDMALGTGYRMSFAHKTIGNRDMGTVQRWVDRFGKKLKASLLTEQKRRLDAMAAAGDQDATRELADRYAVLKSAVDTQTNAFKLRLINSLKQQKYYQGLDKSGK